VLPLEKEIYEQEFLGPTRIENQPPGLEGHNLISASVAGHARFRKASGVAFSDKVVKWQEPITTQHVDFLIQKLRQTVGENGDKGSNIVKCRPVDQLHHLRYHQRSWMRRVLSMP
jgi:hypothetical protein